MTTSKRFNLGLIFGFILPVIGWIIQKNTNAKNLENGHIETNGAMFGTISFIIILLANFFIKS